MPMVGNIANRGFIHTLGSNSAVLRKQTGDFQDITAKASFDSMYFYETRLSPTAKRNVRSDLLFP